MAFRHIRSIISEASTDQTLYTVPSGKEFMLLRTRARYEGGSSSGDGSGDIIASNGTVIFARVNGAFNRAGTTTVHGVTAPYYSRILDSSTSYYVTRVYSIAHQSVMWIITSYDASGTAENWVAEDGYMAYVRSDATSPVGLTFESEHGTPPTFSLGGNSSGDSSVDGNVSVSFKVNSGNAFETIDIDHNAVANGQTWMTLCEAGSVIRANSTNADAMAEIIGIELKAGSWESVGGNGGGGEGSSSSSSEESSSSSSEESSSSSSGSGGGSPSGRYLRVTSSETVGGCAQLYNLTEGDPSMTPFYDTNPLNYHGVTSGGWVITIVYRDTSVVDFYVVNQNIPQTYHTGISDYQWQSLADAISRIKVWNDEEKMETINMTLTLE